MNVAIVNCFDTYEDRVDLLHRYFVDRGDKVRVYTSNWRHFEKKVRDDHKKDFILISAIPYQKNLALSRLVSHKKFSQDIFKRLEKQTIDLLWVLIPPNSFVVSCAEFKKKYPHVRVIIDVIDMWPETMPVERIKKLPMITAWRNLRDRHIQAADHVVTECNLYQERLKSVVPEDKMTTLYLAREVSGDYVPGNPPENSWNLCYLGSINNIIDIPMIGKIISALNQTRPVTLHIIGDGENKQNLIDTAIQNNAEVIDHGKVYDRQKKMEIFGSCHYGLNIMKPSVFVGLTMKSIDYFEAGLPVINNIHGDTWDFVEKEGIGINVDQGSEMASLVEYTADRQAVHSFFERQFSVKHFYQTVDKIREKVC